jgi:flagellar biosynthesis protein FlhF
MKLKSYFSATVEAAMELAHKELGEDALLVNARPATSETRHLGAYEVVFGVMSRSTAAASLPAAIVPQRNSGLRNDAPSANSASSTNSTNARLTQDVADMRRQIERLAHCLNGAHLLTQQSSAMPTSDFYNRMIDNELDGAIAQDVAQGAPLEQFFEVDAQLGRRGSTRAVVALVGPPGAGKTTTLIKLAARYGLASRRPAQIITTDVYRIAAANQLRSLASILGIGCDVAETPLALAQALEEHRLKEFVFVDTPGLASGEMEDGEDLALLIATHSEIDTHLVLPASMKPADMARVIESYAMFQPKKLLFTRLDETDRYGALVNESARRSMPVSFLTAGQQIPDDLEPATKARLVELIAGPMKSLHSEKTLLDKTIGAAA